MVDPLRYWSRLRAAERSGGCWPTAPQEQLLRAALRPPTEALDAWQKWATKGELDRLDHASISLLPQVHRNLLGSEAVLRADLGRLTGLARQSWYRNQLVLHDAAAILPALAGAGVPALLLGGAAVVLRYDPSLAIRPIDDLGVLVAMSDLPRAGAALAGIGWQPTPQHPPEARPRFVRLANQRGMTFDLHTRLFAEDLAPDAAAEIWRRAEVVDWQDARASVLAPVDQLLHVCLHGLRWRSIPEVRWLADAALIVERDADRIEAQTLVQAADRHHASLPLRLGLTYLREQLAASVPPGWIEQLGQLPCTARERLEMGLLCRPPGRVLGGLPVRTARWLRLTHACAVRERIFGFPSFLAEDLGCDGVVDLMRFSAGEIVRRTASLAQSVKR